MGCSSSALQVSQGGAVATTDFFQKYRLGKKLGQGNFAQVRTVTEHSKQLAKVKVTFEKAVKIQDLRETRSSDGKRRMLCAANEAHVLKRLGYHTNCIEVFEVIFCHDFSFIVMERCSGTLLQHLASFPDLNERSMGEVFVQMLSAINHIHMAHVVHRDIKVDNFLVGGGDGATIKLCDFGLSVFLHPGTKKRGLCGTLPRGLCGTLPFMCPEMIKDQWYDAKADVWSFGVVAHLLLFGKFPYVTTSEVDSFSIRKAIAKGIAPKLWLAEEIGGRCSDIVFTFVKALLQCEPVGRPSAKHALSMPYMSMIGNHCYMLGIELPSLKPVLSCARDAGACDFHDLSEVLPMDGWLNMLQLELGGVKLPELKQLQMQLRGDAPLDSQPTSNLPIEDFQAWLSEDSTYYESSTIDFSLSSPKSSDSSMALEISISSMQKFSL